MQRSATRVLRRDAKRDAWLNARAIQVQESAKNPSRHGLNIIARVTLQTTSRERSGKCKCTNGVHIPRKTGEEQVLLLTVPTLRQRKKRIQFCSTWVDRYALRALEYAQGQQPRECWLCEADQPAEVRRRTDVTSRRRWLSVSRRKPETATHHTKGVWMRHRIDHTANIVAICSKPSRTEERSLLRGSEAAEYSLWQ